MPQVQVVQANESQAQAMRANVAQLFGYCTESVNPVVAARYAWWASMVNIAASYDFDLGQVAGADVVALNAKADQSAKTYARMFVALDSGQAECVGRADESELRLGVALKGEIPKPLGVFALLPVIVMVGAAGVAWLAWDAWMEARTAEADALKAHEANQAKRLELMKLAQASGPSAVAQLTQLFQAADQSAQKPAQGVLAHLATLAGGIVSTVTKSAAGLGTIVLIGLAFYWWSKRKSR